MDYNTLMDIVKCGVCKDRMKQPKTLPCNHSFCMDCIDETHRCRPYTTNDAKCPVCRRRFVLTYGGAVELPDNIYLNELLEKLENARKDGADNKTTIPCQKCPDKSATNTCVGCHMNMCNTCAEVHSVIPDAIDHHIINLTNLDQKQREALARMSMITAKCVKHNIYPSRYCLNKQCMQLVCPECCLDDHKEHQILNLNDCASHSKEKLKKISEKALLMEAKAKIEIDHFDDMIADKLVEKNMFKDQVSNLFTEFRERLSKYEEQLLKNGCSKHDKCISQLEAHKTESVNMMANIVDIIHNAKATQKIGTNAFIVSEQYHLESCLDEIENEGTEINGSDDNVKIEIVKENSLGKIFQGKIFRIQEMVVSKKKNEEPVNSDYDLATDVANRTGCLDEDLKPDRIYENTSETGSRRPERTKSVLSLPLPSLPSQTYKRHLSYTSLNGEDRNELGSSLYCNYSDTRHDYPTRLSSVRKMHIDSSSMISGLTVTRDHEIVAVLGNEKKVLIIKYDERSRQTTVLYDVKRNWIQPWDAAASYSDKRKRTTVFVTDSDNNQGYIVSFEIKKKEVVKTKTLITSWRLQPKGIATNGNDIFVCDSEQRCVIVYQTNGQFKHKIGLSNTFTHPMYIGYDNDILLVTDDVRGSIIHVKTNGEFQSETFLDSTSVSQVGVDAHGTIFVGNFKMPVLHALIDDKRYNVDGDFDGILQTTAIAMDNQSRVIVGHSKGIDVLQVNYRYGDI